MSANAHITIQAAPPRKQPIRLPTEPGFSGALVEEATVEQLEACLRKDRIWLHGGAATDEEGGTREVVGFLGDLSRNPGKYRFVDDYLAHANKNSADYRHVARVHARIAAIEHELAIRAEAAHDEAAERRASARKKLSAWHATVPATVAAFHASAEQAAKDWALIAPIVAALERLQATFPNPHAALPEAYSRLRVQEAEVASVLGQSSHEFAELPVTPTFEDVKRATAVLRQLWPESTVPKTGLEKMALARTLNDARSGDVF